MKNFQETLEKLINDDDLDALNTLLGEVTNRITKKDMDDIYSYLKNIRETNTNNETLNFYTPLLVGLIYESTRNDRMAITGYSLAIYNYCTDYLGAEELDDRPGEASCKALAALRQIQPELLNKNTKLLLLLKFMINKVAFYYEGFRPDDPSMSLNFYEFAINLAQDPHAMYRTASLYVNAHKSGVKLSGDKLIEALKYLRLALKNNYPEQKKIKEIVKYFKKNYLMHKGIDIKDRTAIAYHRAIILQKDHIPPYYIQANPKEMIRLLAEDDLLSQKEKFKYLESILQSHPKISLEADDPQGIDLLGDYYLQRANQILHSPPRDIDTVIGLYEMVPATSRARGAACLYLAVCRYTELKEYKVSDKAAFFAVQKVLNEGIKLGDPECIDYYVRALNVAIGENSAETFDDDTTNQMEKIKISEKKFQEQLATEEKELLSEIELYEFIKKHKLNDVDYWRQQVTVDGKKIVVEGKEITVPHSIIKMFVIIDSEKTAAEKCKELSSEMKLYEFIKKHKLDDVNYWHQQVTVGGKKIVVEGKELSVPHGIAKMFDIIHSEKTAEEKCKDLARIHSARSQVNVLVRFFTRKSSTQHCYNDASQLSCASSDTDPRMNRG